MGDVPFHRPPKGYYYKVEKFKKDILSIYLHHEYSYDYNNGKPVKTIWGFYNTKTKEFFSPINSTTIGKVVDVNKTTKYTAMPILN